MDEKTIINALGGSTVIAQQLRLTPQAVNQWKTRGFPQVKSADMQKLIAKGRKLVKKNISPP